MSPADFVDRIRGYGDRLAFPGVTYTEFCSMIQADTTPLDSAGKGPVLILGHDGPAMTARIIASWLRGRVAIPVQQTDQRRRSIALQTCAVGAVWAETLETVESGSVAPLLQPLLDDSVPGLVLFTSGSTSEPKAVLHDAGRLLSRFQRTGRSDTTGLFMSLDHIGGLNTALYALNSGGTVVPFADRSPDEVAWAIASQGVTLLPTTPSFIRLLLLSGAHVTNNLGSLRLITFGGEPMPPATLEALQEAFPNVELLQQFGMSETGVLRSKSRGDGWMKLGGEGYETRVRDGQLEIKSKLAMLGYLNAPSPFTPDGWLATGDLVETDGDYIRVLGRAKEVLNVGGEKVHPGEVESAIEDMDGVVCALVKGESHPLVGQVLVAQITLSQPEPLSDFRVRMRTALKNVLPSYMIPSRVVITEAAPISERHKKSRVA